MRKTLAEIAQAIGGRVVGDDSLVVTGVSGIKEAREGDITFLANPKYLPLAKSTLASVIIVANDVTVEGKSVIQVDNPSLAFAGIVGMVKEDLTPRIQGIHPTAVIAADVVIGEGAGIGPHVVIESGSRVGSSSVICAGVYIGRKSSVGERCLIYPNVTIREDVAIGNHVIIHSGSVLGSDGFGYVQMGDVHVKVPQTGSVVVEDDVEIGACVTIDRARFDRTVIGRGTKIDNLVQIAHNVQIGRNCLIIAQVGIAGSAVLGNNVTIAGQVGVTGHITVGDRVVVGAQSGITKSVPAGAKMFGTPADDYKETIRLHSHLKKLPLYVDMIEELQAKVKALEDKLGKT
ncbi:MAG: UDP-3-O-(3-hydroxymyristoyl)glucosamine N-acyltransferase [Candidatus Omnitrophica bacterium]|nr:UDP-3-O-(3-hydroxymyristoyl)glucosamine N-acyltransferase [Candidatus Omnitrophota bacterium]